MSLTHALKWSFLSELASKLVQPVVFVVLARLLTPEDFGVMSAALMVMAFSQIFWEAGMGKALIQRQKDVETAANVAFWVNFGLGVIIAGLLYVAAKPIAQTFFQDPRVTAVIQVMTFQVFLGALGSVQTALLQKEMGFKKLFWVRFATVSLPGLASIPLAWQGMGYWALVAGTLAGQVAQVIMLWYMSPWRPDRSFHLPVAKEMGMFGAWVGLSGLLAWFYTWMDALIVGMYLGSHDLGVYKAGTQFVATLFALFLSSVIPVLYSAMSKNGEQNIGVLLERSIRMFGIVFIPVSLLLFCFSRDIAGVLFSGRWDGIGDVIAVISLTSGLACVVAPCAEAYRSSGYPKYEALVMLISAGFFFPIFLISVKGGLDEFLIGRLVAVVAVGYWMHVFFSWKILKLKVSLFLPYPLIVGGSWLVGYGLHVYSLSEWREFILMAIASVATTYLALSSRADIKKVLEVIPRKI